MFVYKVTNLIDGKCYVGKTRRSLEERFKEHSKANSGLGNAIRELGIEKFKIEVLEECTTPIELDKAEKRWIKKLNCCFPNGYNFANGFAEANYKKNSLENVLSQKNFSGTDVAQALLPGKWMIPILYKISEGTKRFNELRRTFGISQPILAKELKILEQEGIIKREIFAEVPPRVEYSLTEIGKSFQPVLDSIEIWGKSYIEYLKERDNFD